VDPKESYRLWKTATDAETAEQYCAAMAENLDSPFEDLQPTPVVLALIQDWLEES
jgi:hypothetical protein